ncbi:hypothetical protein LSTR_LSTR003095 [Laodelphax striatellus]|uniref:Uncharacterized protein n=1 Tax=Laodelphax striatellus TaxID=195883 RepID=A0A482WVX2_LAOST|nr:hypothetical protein LSTR_LSTR003095 [Laodelphax striatellus]
MCYACRLTARSRLNSTATTPQTPANHPTPRSTPIGPQAPPPHPTPPSHSEIPLPSNRRQPTDYTRAPLYRFTHSAQRPPHTPPHTTLSTLYTTLLSIHYEYIIPI